MPLIYTSPAPREYPLSNPNIKEWERKIKNDAGIAEQMRLLREV